MRLRLRYLPTSAHMADHAAICVESAADVSDIDLDYSVASLNLLDNLLEELRQDGPPADEFGNTLFTFGAYVGEVFVRNAGATWSDAADSNMAGLTPFPVVVNVGVHRTTCNPIDKVFKRYENGQEDFLPYFYQVFTADESGEPSKPQKRPWRKRR